MSMKMRPHTQDDERDPIADAIRYAARELGMGGAATPMGALETVALEIRNGFASCAGALSEIAAALQEVAAAIQERGDDA